MVDPVADRLRLLARAPDAAEEVDEAVALLVPLLDHGVALGQLRPQRGEHRLEARVRLRPLVRVEARLLELLLVVEDDDVLAGLRDAPDRALAERLAVGRPAEHAPRRRRVQLVPPVLLDVLRQRDDQLRLHELRVRLVALVALGHVGAAAGRERARHRADEAVEVLEDEVDLDARMARLELLAQLLEHGLEPRVLVVVRPHRERGRLLLRPVRHAHADRDEHDGDEDDQSCQAPLHVPSFEVVGSPPGSGRRL